MKRANCSSEDGNGSVVLPIGFRFHPTDQELILHYLKRKVLSFPLPAINFIPEFDVFQTNPWDLPGDLKEKRYFFSKRKRISTVNKFSASCGYWKSSGKDRQIVAPGGGNIVIGIKKSFFFSKRNSGEPETQWIMHQFRLVAPVIAPYLAQKLLIEMGDWVVCRVYQRKRKARSIRRPIDDMNLRMRNSYEKGLLSSDLPPPPNSRDRTMEVFWNGIHPSFFEKGLSSCSSGITEISVSDLEQEVNSPM